MKYLLLLPMICLARVGLGQELPGLILHSTMQNSCQLADETDGLPANGVMIDVSLAPDRNNASNSAIAFDQNSSYITFGAVDKLKLPGDKSISFWIKPTVTGINRTGSIFSYGTAMVIGYQEQTTVPQLTISFGNTLYLQANLTTQWQSVTITFEKDYSSTKSKASLYIDGLLKSSSEQNKTSQTFNKALAIMGPANLITPLNGFIGTLDDFRIYNRLLTPKEILNARINIETFSAKRIKGVVQLNWKTSVEENISHFDVQRSMDGSIFQTINKTLAGKVDYQVFDNTAPIDADLWYRLQIVDKAEKTEYSNVIRVMMDTAIPEAGLIMFPNPALSTINFRGYIDHNIIKIFSITGTVVRHQQLVNKMNIADLRPGMYYVVIYDNMRNKRMVSKFIKRND